MAFYFPVNRLSPEWWVPRPKRHSLCFCHHWRQGSFRGCCHRGGGLGSGECEQRSLLGVSTREGRKLAEPDEVGNLRFTDTSGGSGVTLPYGLTSVHPSGQRRPAFQSPQRTEALSPGLKGGGGREEHLRGKSFY